MIDTAVSDIHCVRALAAKDFKSGTHPVWCPGCGDYGVLAGLERGLARRGRAPHEIVLVSGIGCSSRLPAYTTCYGFHGVHGRALPFAAGLKLARPDLDVIAVGGDGDGYSIGGNHFIHACRRNVDMLYIVMDNRVYAMTKGQPSPTTEADWTSEIAPDGTGLRPLDPLLLAIAAGANFVARGFAGDPDGLADMIVAGMRWPGFALLEVLSPCLIFRPDEVDWKKQVRPAAPTIENNRAVATATILADDGLGMGIIFTGERAQAPARARPSNSLEAIERQFALAPPQ